MAEVQINRQSTSARYEESIFAENEMHGMLSQNGATPDGVIPLPRRRCKKIRVLHAVEFFSTGVLQCIAFICDALKDELCSLSFTDPARKCRITSGVISLLTRCSSPGLRQGKSARLATDAP